MLVKLGSMVTLYRVVGSLGPTATDFQSYVALGRVPTMLEPARRRIAEGISVYATLQQARRNARAFPGHGRFIAELSIPDGAPIAIERTGRQPGHHTIWADSAELLSYVVSVERV